MKRRTLKKGKVSLQMRKELLKEVCAVILQRYKLRRDALVEFLKELGFITRRNYPFGTRKQNYV